MIYEQELIVSREARNPAEMGKLREKITSRQNNAVQTFISDQAPEHHEAFQKRGFFDQQRRQYVARAPHQ